MGEFLKGWRRKIGLLTLLMACVFAGGWVRNIHFYDSLELQFRRINFSVLASSGDGTFDLVMDTIACREPRFLTFGSLEFAEILRSRNEDPSSGDDDSVIFNFFGIVRLGRYGCGGNGYSGSGRYLGISYPLIVATLTLLSAWLLLSKSRAKSEPSMTPNA